MKVYVITSAAFDDYELYAAYAKEEDAKAFVARNVHTWKDRQGRERITNGYSYEELDVIE